MASPLYHLLAHLVTQYDRKQAAKRSYNPNALGIYLGRVEDVVKEVSEGTTLARALYDNFNDRLLSYLERHCNLPVTFGGGPSDIGRPA